MINKTVFVSNILFEPYLQTYLSQAFSSIFSAIQLTHISNDEINENHIIRDSDIIVICLNFDELYPNALNDVTSNKISSESILQDVIRRSQELYFSIKTRSNAQIIWFGFEDYYINSDIVHGTVPVFDAVVDIANQSISDMLKEDTFIDFKRLIAKVGINNSYNSKGKYRWNAPYSKKLIEAMTDEVYKQYLVQLGKTKKCIVLDCDNVLWKGILSEDGIEGIRLDGSGLGEEYQDFQRFLLTLYYHGVILTICSKNDESDVLCVFREHSGMLLSEEHFACLKVNWNDKPTNIKEIADELNIGTDSMVFIDDSLFELEAVKSVLPEVTTIRYDRESMYKEFSCFNLNYKVNLLDVKNRNATYRTNLRRAELKQNSSSYEDYIKSLDIKVEIHKVLPTEYSRVSELTQRTNKCTNGKRYTVNELKERMLMKGVCLYSVSVSDRFSDLGIVGAIEIENDVLKLFSLSCRALGRSVENEMLKYMVRDHCIKNIEFNLTKKNESLRNLLQKLFSNADFRSLE